MQIYNKKTHFGYIVNVAYTFSYRDSSFHLLDFKLKCVLFSRKSILAFNSIKV